MLQNLKLLKKMSNQFNIRLLFSCNYKSYLLQEHSYGYLLIPSKNVKDVSKRNTIDDPTEEVQKRPNHHVVAR